MGRRPINELPCGKECYHSRDDARQSRDQMRRGRKLSSGGTTIYFCEGCNAYHWGHNRKRKYMKGLVR